MEDSRTNPSSSSSSSSVRRVSRDRLRRYVADIIRIQTTPLRDVILRHALLHLPVQSLLRLRCVSRSWAHQIASPFFLHSHSLTRRSPSGLFFHASDPVISYLPFDPAYDSLPDPFLSFVPYGLSLAAASNGLVALKSTRAPYDYCICNPATRRWTQIPRRIRKAGTAGEGGCALVFHPTALNFSADYYLICGVSADDDKTGANATIALDVFSSASATWTRSKALVPKLKGEQWASVAVDGVAYWRAAADGGCGVIVSYDPAKDSLSIVEPPAMSTLDGDWEVMRWQVAEVGGKLCCVAASEGVVEVYELAEELGSAGATWRRRTAVEVDGDPWPLVSQGLEDVVVVWMDGMVMRIDLRRRESTVVGIDISKLCVNGMPYIANFVPVKEFQS